MASIMFSNPFKEKGFWYKGNLHTHTTTSDGMLSVRQLTYLYRAHGYSFLAITDHNKVAKIDEIDLENFLIIKGVELSTGKALLGDKYHLTCIGIEELPKVINDPQEVINEVKNMGGEVIISHPYWSMLTLHDIVSLNNYIGIEVFNMSCQVSIGKGVSTFHWDALLTCGKEVYGFAVDDAHWHFDEYRPVDTCKAWIMVKAKELSLEALMNSLRMGLFYSSTGPKINDITVTHKKITVKCSPVKAISFIADHSKGRVFTSKGIPLREATYEIKGHEKYVRIECIDFEGNTAWTNPIIIK